MGYKSSTNLHFFYKLHNLFNATAEICSRKLREREKEIEKQRERDKTSASSSDITIGRKKYYTTSN